MNELKTKVSDASVKTFIDSVESDRQRADSTELIDLMRSVTGAEPKMWGTSIVGFGSYHYRYESGREGDWMLCGFSPRKGKTSIYIMSGLEKCDNLLKQLGKHSTGKSCLYIRKLDDVDRDVLRELIETSVRDMRARYETST